jgi:membrane-associated phospholipid phosphatase
MTAAAALLGVTVLILAAAVWHVHGPTSLDRAPRLLIPRATQRRWLFHDLALLGSAPVVVAAVALLAAWAAQRRDYLAAALAVVGPALTVFLTEVVLKPLVDRRAGGGLLFPSGHVASATAVAVVVVLLAYRWWGMRVAVAVALPAACVPMTVTLGVVRLEWHYVTDAAGGLALGAAAVLAVAVALSEAWARGPALPD